jgi:serine kinase of HPr protein (carbohydrate metabolism regulator)
MDEGLYPNLVFPVVSVLFGGDDNEKLGKELHNFMNKNMQFATISNNFSIDEELKNYKQFEKIMIWFANEYMIQIFDSLDYETQKYMQNLFKNINKNDKK